MCQKLFYQRVQAYFSIVETEANLYKNRCEFLWVILQLLQVFDTTKLMKLSLFATNGPAYRRQV